MTLADPGYQSQGLCPGPSSCQQGRNMGRAEPGAGGRGEWDVRAPRKERRLQGWGRSEGL